MPELDSASIIPSPDYTVVEQLVRQVPGLDRAAVDVARAIHEAVLAGGNPTRTLADLLHGTWLGHPLHPALVTVPVGAWSLAALFDALDVLSGGGHPGQVADALVGAGLLSALPTALAGMADYSAIKQDAAASAAVHALMNGTSFGLYALSFAARRAGWRGTGRLTAALGLGILLASAVVGGDMVYRQHVGVSHSPPAAPTDWTQAVRLDALDQRTPRRVEVDGVPVLIYRDGEEILAIGAVCSHAGGPLDEGRIADGCVECPWHQSVFNLHDGAVVHGPATMRQPSYEARVRDGWVDLRVAGGGDR